MVTPMNKLETGNAPKGLQAEWSAATIFLPSSDSMTITESGQPLARVAGVRLLRMEWGRAVLEAGSGSYRFGSLMPGPP
jgi:hypothetical protein